jgi:hypothetical protein
VRRLSGVGWRKQARALADKLAEVAVSGPGGGDGGGRGRRGSDQLKAGTKEHLATLDVSSRRERERAGLTLVHCTFSFSRHPSFARAAALKSKPASSRCSQNALFS